MIKAIETYYKGYQFRSRLEARWAMFFDALGVAWEYEKEGYDLGDAGWYLPDFWLPTWDCWIEIKPYTPPPVHRIFLAGKMSDWRNNLKTHGHIITGPDTHLRIINKPDDEYGGQRFTCTNNFGVDSGGASVSYITHCIWQDNAQCIKEADRVFAWINTLDAYGTIAEIAWASANRIPVYLAMTSSISSSELYCGHNCGNAGALWVIEAMSTSIYDKHPDFCEEERIPQMAFDYWFPLQDQEKKAQSLAIGTSSLVCIIYGDPRDLKKTQNDIFCGQSIFRNTKSIWSDFCADNICQEASHAIRAVRLEHGQALVLRSLQ